MIIMWQRSSRTQEAPANRCPVSGKIIYLSRKLAQIASIRFKRRKRRSFTKGERALQVFACGECGGFHIGHRRTDQNSYRGRQRAHTNTKDDDNGDDR